MKEGSEPLTESLTAVMLRMSPESGSLILGKG